jgi:hypothetical protein
MRNKKEKQCSARRDTEKQQRNNESEVTYQPYIDLHQSSGQAYNFRAAQIERHRQLQFPTIRELLALEEEQLVPDPRIYEIVPK